MCLTSSLRGPLNWTTSDYGGTTQHEFKDAGVLGEAPPPHWLLRLYLCYVKASMHTASDALNWFWNMWEPGQQKQSLIFRTVLRTLTSKCVKMLQLKLTAATWYSTRHHSIDAKCSALMISSSSRHHYMIKPGAVDDCRGVWAVKGPRPRL